MANLPICSVQTDSFAAAKELTNYLFAKHHDKIGLITSDSSVSTIDERVNGFLSAHVDANRAVSQKQILSRIDSVVPSSSRKIEDDVALIVAFLQKNPEITALLPQNTILLYLPRVRLNNWEGKSHMTFQLFALTILPSTFLT